MPPVRERRIGFVPARSSDESPTRRSATWLVVVAVLAVVAVAGWLAVRATDGEQGRADRAEGPADVAPGDRAQPVTDALAAQQAALADRDRAAFLRTWSAGDESQRDAAEIFDNLDRLDA